MALLQQVVTAISGFRRGEKSNVIDYAERTVRKAQQSLNGSGLSRQENELRELAIAHPERRLAPLLDSNPIASSEV